jgi:arylsulfatase A-like enzyme
LLNVGLIFKGPGVPQGKSVDEPVSTLDLAATFYDYANVEKPESIQSESVRNLVEGEGSRDVAYNEWNVNATRCGVPLELRTIRTKTHKCTFELESGAGELYDLVNDPHEMDNLFDDTSAKSARKELEDMMQERPGIIRNKFAEPVGAA